jgi:hypothetical protein
MRGATTVNEEFEVGFDQNFESHWYRAEQVGRIIMVLSVVVSALGLLGRGPFSHATVRSATGAITVDYEPVARQGTATVITIHVKKAAGRGAFYRIADQSADDRAYGLPALDPTSRGQPRQRAWH